MDSTSTIKKLNIVIPWRDSGCLYRKKHFEYLYQHYCSICDVIVCDDTRYKSFNRSASRNIGVKKSDSELILVVDADCYISKETIEKSLSFAQKNKKIVRPFNSVHYLNISATNRFYLDKHNFSPNSNDYEERTPEQILIDWCGGAYLFQKHIWEDVGGMNEKFLGWGLEDKEFNDRSIKKYGDHIYIDAPLISLYHPSERTHSKLNEQLYISLKNT